MSKLKLILFAILFLMLFFFIGSGLLEWLFIILMESVGY